MRNFLGGEDFENLAVLLEDVFLKTGFLGKPLGRFGADVGHRVTSLLIDAKSDSFDVVFRRVNVFCIFRGCFGGSSHSKPGWLVVFELAEVGVVNAPLG